MKQKVGTIKEYGHSLPLGSLLRSLKVRTVAKYAITTHIKKRTHAGFSTIWLETSSRSINPMLMACTLMSTKSVVTPPCTYVWVGGWVGGCAHVHMSVGGYGTLV